MRIYKDVFIVMALTGFDRKVDHDTAIAAGFQWHLAKPVKQDQLLSVVATLAGRTKIM
jgi:two-component system, chemotaxis family, CheB/CheR fusion protein